MRALFLLCILLKTNYIHSQKKETSFNYWIKKYITVITYNKDSAYYCAKKALTIAEKSKNNENIAKGYFYVGKAYLSKEESEEAILWFNKALKLAQEKVMDSLIAATYDRIGSSYANKENYSDALNYYYKGLKIAKQKNYLKLEADLFTGIAYTYYSKNDFNKTIENYNFSIEISKKIDYKKSLFFAYNGLGCLYTQKNKIDEAISNLEKAVLIGKQLKDNNKIFQAYSNLVNVEVNQNKIDIEKVDLHMEKLKEIVTQTNEDNKWMYYYSYLADYSRKKNNFSSAIQNNLKTIEFAKKTNDIFMESECYSILSGIYEEKKDLKSSLNYLKQYHTLKDSIQKIDNNEAFAEIQTKYDVEVKNLKIKTLTQEKKAEALRKKWALLISIIIILFLSSIIFTYIQRVKSQKLLRDKDLQLFEIEKDKLEQEAHLKKILGIVEGQDEERNRIASEIHDGVGAKLSTIKMQLSKNIETNEKNELIKTISKIDEVFQELRSISHNLSQNYINQRGLIELVSQLKEDIEKTSSIQIEWVYYPFKKLNEINYNIKKHIYRILQELINNTLKHANATQININLTLHQDELSLIYEDNGKGTLENNLSGIGLKNIEERIKTLQGNMTLENAHSKEFSFIITIPIN